MIRMKICNMKLLCPQRVDRHKRGMLHMTDKEFKRLNRAELIDIIYQLQLKQEELTAENEKLSKALADRRLHISKAGNIAEATLGIHNVMQAAQDAAAHYLEEIHMMRNETEVRCRRLLEKTQKEAEAIIAQAKQGKPYYNSDLEEIIKEFGPKG